MTGLILESWLRGLCLKTADSVGRFGFGGILAKFTALAARGSVEIGGFSKLATTGPAFPEGISTLFGKGKDLIACSWTQLLSPLSAGNIGSSPTGFVCSSAANRLKLETTPFDITLIGAVTWRISCTNAVFGGIIFFVKLSSNQKG
jgi:hypothetical protein